MKKHLPRIALGLAGLFALIMWAPLLLSPFQDSGPRKWRRPECQIRMRQLVLAMHTYHDVHGHLPPAVVFDDLGNPMHSWRALILPFLETDGIGKRYNFEQPWDSTHNLAVAEALDFRLFQCSKLEQRTWWGGTRPPKNRLTNYLALTGSGTAFERRKQTTFDSFTDGAGNAILLVDISNSDVRFLEPRDITAEEFVAAFARSRAEIAADDIRGSEPCEFSRHGTLKIGLADASWRDMQRRTSDDTVRALTTIAAGDTVGKY